ncbi:MAG TPA: hypothetical protein DG754_14325 [Bacteroidales bacterium]|jgi:hypothetical protein|nr:hypothetical protein [Bacteroidales bacterium]
MKNKIFNKLRAILVVLFLGGNLLYAQVEKPQNIYRVTVNSRYVIENGERTSTFFAINQLIYDSLGRLHTEIDFDWETHYPNNYRWNYFNGQQKVKTDFFFKEKLSRIEEYDFNENQKLISLTLYHVSPSDTTLSVKEVYSYDKTGHVTKATGYNERGKRGYRTTSKYDDKGNEIYRKVKGKRIAPPDSIMYLQKEIAYDSLNRIGKETVTIDKIGEPRLTKTYTYAYTDDGNITEKTIIDSQGNIQKRKEYVYRSDKRLQQIKVFDNNGNLEDHLAWRYEIYKTSDRRFRTLE